MSKGLVTDKAGFGCRGAPCLSLSPSQCRYHEQLTREYGQVSQRSRVAEDLELGVAELQRIMQGAPQKGQIAGGFYGMSPPTRTSGAANPMGLDSTWRNTAYRATHSNLQALREMSVPACLRNNTSGDVLCIPESPDCGFLSAELEVFDGEEEDNRASPASCMTHY